MDWLPITHSMETQMMKVEMETMVRLLAFGSLAIEHTFGALLKIFPIEDVVSFLTRGKTRFGIPAKNIEIGVQADLTLFTPMGTKTITKESILSTSKNSLYIGEALPGNVYGVLAQGKALLQKV